MIKIDSGERPTEYIAAGDMEEGKCYVNGSGCVYYCQPGGGIENEVIIASDRFLRSTSRANLGKGRLFVEAPNASILFQVGLREGKTRKEIARRIANAVKTGGWDDVESTILEILREENV